MFLDYRPFWLGLMALLLDDTKFRIWGTTSLSLRFSYRYAIYEGKERTGDYI